MQKLYKKNHYRKDHEMVTRYVTRNHCFFSVLKPFTVFFCFCVFPSIRKKEIFHSRIPNPGFLEDNQLSILRCVLVRAFDIRIGP